MSMDIAYMARELIRRITVRRRNETLKMYLRRVSRICGIGFHSIRHAWYGLNPSRRVLAKLRDIAARGLDLPTECQHLAELADPLAAAADARGDCLFAASLRAIAGEARARARQDW